MNKSNETMIPPTIDELIKPVDWQLPKLDNATAKRVILYALEASRGEVDLDNLGAMSRAFVMGLDIGMRLMKKRLEGSID
jgi:hypothetical protein